MFPFYQAIWRQTNLAKKHFSPHKFWQLHHQKYQHPPFFCLYSCVRGWGSAGVHPSGLWAKVGLHLGQVTSLSQAHIETNNRSHTLTPTTDLDLSTTTYLSPGIEPSTFLHQPVIVCACRDHLKKPLKPLSAAPSPKYLHINLMILILKLENDNEVAKSICCFLCSTCWCP